MGMFPTLITCFFSLHIAMFSNSLCIYTIQKEEKKYLFSQIGLCTQIIKLPQEEFQNGRPKWVSIIMMEPGMSTVHISTNFQYFQFEFYMRNERG